MSALDHPENLANAAPIWLVTIAACGRIWRIASEVITVASDDGDLIFDAGIDDLTVDEALGEPGESPGEPIASIEEAHLDGAVAATTYGHDLVAGRGEVALFLRGTTWEDRRVLVAGRIRSASVGADDLCSVVIGDTLEEDRGRVLDSTAIVDATTWPSAAEPAIGAPYPRPFGRPGVYTDSDGGALSVAASPALMVDATGAAERLLISAEPIEASSVTIVNLDDDTSDNFAVTTTADGAGRDTAIVSLATPGTLTVDEANSYGVIFDQGGEGGVYNARMERLEGAGDVILSMLARSTLPIDYAAWEALRGDLNAFLLSGYVDDPDATPMDWLTDNVIPLLPISLVFGPTGLAPFLWRAQLRGIDAEMVIDTAIHVGDVELETLQPEHVGEFIPTLTMHYAFAIDGEDHRRHLTLTGDPAVTSPTATTAPTCQLRSIWLAHVARTGSTVPASDEITSDIVGDDLTAAKVLGWRAELTSSPRLRPRYAVSWAFGWARLGMVVQLTDAAIGLTDRVGVIDAISWSALGPTLSIRLQLDVARDLSATA